MPGSVYTGYLNRQKLYEDEITASEEKKRKKVEESLIELNISKLKRDMENFAWDWEKKKATEEAVSMATQRLQDMQNAGLLPPGTVETAIAGIKLPESEKAESPYGVGSGVIFNKQTGTWKRLPETQGGEGGMKLGTPQANFTYGYDENGKLVFTPKAEGLEATDIPKLMTGLLQKSFGFEGRGIPETRTDSLMAGFPITPQTDTERAYQALQKKLIEFATGGGADTTGQILSPLQEALNAINADVNLTPAQKQDLIAKARAQFGGM